MNIENQPKSRAKPRVLLVDDEVKLRDHLASRLADEYEIEVADNGTQALRAILRSPPDLVATDVVMPDMDGIELLRTLRSTRSTQTIPVLLISGHAPDELRIAGFEHEADGYLSKPYTERELRARIRSLLRIASVRNEVARRQARKEAEQQAMTERAALLESITDAFYALDQQWCITYMNQRALDYFGLERQSALGKNIWDLLPVGKGSLFQQRYEEAMRSGKSVGFEAVSPHSGIWIEVKAFPTPYGLAIHFRDISDRKRSEEALRNAEERYRAFVLNSSEAIWRYELDEPLDLSLPIDAQIEHVYRHARLAELNDAMARMYGYERAEELIGARLQQMLPREDATSHVYLRAAVERGFRFSELESAERDRKGEVRYFSNAMVPVIEDGRLIRSWGMQRDVTERKRAQEAVEEADRRKDEFLAILAHELRNPLSPLKNGLQIARLTVAPESSLKPTIDMMDRQLEHLVRLVDDLLDVARISSGKISLRNEAVMLREVLAQSTEGCRAHVEAREQRLVIESTADELCVQGDFDRLAQVFSNLISNASKYTEAGGGIRVSLTKEKDEAVIRVIDTGIGIPVDDLPRLFELFSQVRSHQGHAQGGLGIGLSLVHNLVELHGGTVVASSLGPGTGSTFTVRLPLRSAPLHGHSETDQPITHSPVKCRVLVVDDNEDAAASLAQFLQIHGHDVAIAHSGPSAIAQAPSFRPHVIFLDLGMPGMDGIETAYHLRNSASGNEALIVALTGWGQAEDRRRTQEAGFDAHLVKPADPRAIADLLARRRRAD
jgi:PAS domain S-box-containing protein